MPIFSDETRAARAALVAARQNLDLVDDRHEESDAYLAANQAVADAARPLRWWQRADIDAGFYPDRAREAADSEVDQS